MGLFNRRKKEYGQTLYFQNGQLKKVVGGDGSWYDAQYIVSDKKQYNLSSVDDIRKVSVPAFQIIDPLSGYGTSGSLDYVLHAKAANCFNRHEYDLCSVLLWKSTQLMLANKYFAWTKSHYECLIKWHIQMGMPDQAEKARQYLADNGIVINDVPDKKFFKLSAKKDTAPAKEKISNREKELMLVQRVTIEDMREILNAPFAWNSPIKKHIAERSHPFAYMDIVGVNVDNVKRELQRINDQIAFDEKFYPKVINGARIPLAKIVFKPSLEYGHTKIICTPKTITGKPVKYPFKLFFCTDLSSMNETHGEIVYDQSGNIASANIYCWRNGSGSLLYYKSVEGKLVLSSGEKAGYNK